MAMSLGVRLMHSQEQLAVPYSETMVPAPTLIYDRMRTQAEALAIVYKAPAANLPT
jgi:hypothetical protein